MAAELSPRETEVWALLNTPLTYNEIAQRLFISARTVESHVNSLRRKLDAADRRELARLWGARRHTTGLPAELSSFIGRESELGQIADALARDRLVSLVGPGGAGKTRLVVRAARQWAEATSGQCSYVDLVPLRPGANIAASVALACQAASTGDVGAAIAARLSAEPTLLVLDNAEHVLDSTARLVEELLTRAEQLRVLVTSRIRLVLPHERSLLVGGLDTEPAVQLFQERAGTASLDPDRVATICAGLGGLPLAIELAVARLGAFGLDGLEASLHSQLDVLTGGARVAARHRSLEQTIAWSYDLLAGRDRDVLAGVSVFAEPFTASAAEDVLAQPVAASVATLCEHSLLRFEDAPTGTRYRVLEAIREFGRRHLADAHSAQLAARHARWALREGSLAEQRSAAEWCSAQNDTALAHQLWRSLALGYFREGQLREAQAAHEHDATLTSGRERARSFTDAAAIARCRIRGEDATRLDLLAVDAFVDVGARAEAAEALARVGDHAVRFAGMFTEKVAPDEVDRLLARARELADDEPLPNAALAVAHAQRTARDDADPVATARTALAQARSVGVLTWVAGALDALCVALVETGQLAEAADLCLERADLVVGAWEDPRLALEIKDALHTGALVLAGAGRLPEAQRLAVQHLQMPFVRAELDLASEELFAPAALSGEWDAVLDRADRYLTGWRQAGSPAAPGRVIGPLAIALIHRLRGDEAQHERWQQISAAMSGGSDVPAFADVFAAIGLLHIGDAANALECLQRPRRGFFRHLYDEWADALRFEAQVLLSTSSTPPAVSANPVAARIVERARALEAGDRAGVLAAADEFDRLGCPYQARRSTALARLIAT